MFKSYNRKSKTFDCPECDSTLDLPFVEQRLVSWLGTVTAYIGCQDLHCSNTMEPRMDVLSLYSEKGGAYTEKKFGFFKEYEWEVQHQFRDLSQIAQEAGMSNLDGLLKQLISLPHN